MKKLFLLSFLFSMTVFFACEKGAVADELVPEVPTEPVDDVTTDDDNSTTLGLNQLDSDRLTTVPESKAVAIFHIENQSGAVEEESQLVISNTSTDAYTYEWDFGNGDIREGANPTYAFPYHGYYTVTLKVTDENGLVSTATQGLMVICIYGGGDHDY